LRSVIGDPGTVSGDSINLTMLPMGCSTITLGTGGIQGAIVVNQDTLHIHGPGANALTIDGNGAQSIFFHFGIGTLGISAVAISNGYYKGNYAYGGCIYSGANVLLLDSVISHCIAKSTSFQKPSRGGAVYTAGYLALFNSAVERSQALSDSGAEARGGGVDSGGLFTALYSTIADNVADAIGGSFGVAGGILTNGGVDIESSTISGNTASDVGGLDIQWNGTSTLSNSTVSGNKGFNGGGIWTSGQTTIADSTIAFNMSTGTACSAGVTVFNGGTLTLASSIVADNRGPSGQDDLVAWGPAVTVSGSNNLITSWDLVSVSVPADTRTNCPKLDPLANNGGATWTHKLRHDSPAIDQGDPGSLTFDQRGALRVYPDNGTADIGAVEWQPSDQDERILASGFDGVCDW
jgi:hypothetical protein